MKLKNHWPFLALVLVTFLFFWRFFLKGLLPIPSDIITGVYYPWLDLKYPQFPVGVPVKNALPSDVVSLTYPSREFAVSELKQGIIPFWNPYVLSGTALLANFQSAVLYPLNLLYLLTANFALVWSWQVVLQPVLATIFSYLFLRSFRLHRVSSAFGSFVWGFGGFFSLWSQYNTVIHAILYLPLALFALRKMSTKRVYGFLFSLAIFFSFTAGNPPMTLIILLTSGLFCLFEFKSSISKYLWAILYVLLGLGLSAPQLLPSLSLSAASIRDFDQIAFASGIKFLPWYKLITLVVPDYFGNPSTGNVWSIAGLYDNLTVFVGVTPFILAFLALGSKSNSFKPLRLFGLTLASVSLILILKNPVSNYLGSSSFLGLSSMVFTRFSSLLVFAVSLLSALTIEEIIKTGSLTKTQRFLLFIPLLFVTIIMAGTWSKLNLNSHLAVSLRNSILPLLLFILTTGSMFFYRNSLTKPLLIFLFVLTIFDLFRFFNKYNSFNPASFLYPENEIMSFAKTLPGRFGRENDAVSPSNFWLHDRLPFASGYDTLHSLRYNQFLQVLNGGDIDTVSSRYAEVSDPTSPLFDFLGIQNILTTKKLLGVPNSKGSIPYPYDNPKFTKIFESGRMAILKNQKALPLFFAVKSYVLATSSADMQGKLLSSDLRNSALFYEDPLLTLGVTPPTILEVNDRGQVVSLKTQSDGEGLIVSSVVSDAGWRLRVDGEPRKLLTVNHAFLAIPTTKGDREIVLSYAPVEFYHGLWISLSSLFLLATLALIYWKQDDRQN